MIQLRLMPFLFLFLVSCTTAQHIRQSDYYRYDWGLSGMATSQTNEAIKHHPIFSETKDSVERAANYEKNVSYFIFGMLPSENEVKLSEACGSKPFRQAYVDHNFWQATVSLFTLGIYTPRRIKIWCGHETASK